MTDTAGTLDRTHPVAAALSSIDAQLDAVAEAVLWSLGGAEARDLLVRLTTTGARLAELEARVAAHAESVEAGKGVGCDVDGELVGPRHPPRPVRGPPQGTPRRRPRRPRPVPGRHG